MRNWWGAQSDSQQGRLQKKTLIKIPRLLIAHGMRFSDT